MSFLNVTSLNCQPMDWSHSAPPTSSKLCGVHLPLYQALEWLTVFLFAPFSSQRKTDRGGEKKKEQVIVGWSWRRETEWDSDRVEREMRKRGPLCITEEDKIPLPSAPDPITFPTPPFPEMSCLGGMGLCCLVMEKHVRFTHSIIFSRLLSLPKQLRAAFMTVNAFIIYYT